MSADLPETHLDLLTAPLIGALATTGPDGAPQVTGLWFLLESGVIKLSLNGTRQKFRNLSARPLVTLFVIDPTNPYRTIEVRARATAEPDVDYAFADQLVAHYGSPVDLRNVDQPGEARYVVTLEPIKVNTYG